MQFNHVNFSLSNVIELIIKKAILNHCEFRKNHYGKHFKSAIFLRLTDICVVAIFSGNMINNFSLSQQLTYTISPPITIYKTHVHYLRFIYNFYYYVFLFCFVCFCFQESCFCIFALNKYFKI